MITVLPTRLTQCAFGGGNTVLLARINFQRITQSPRQSFETAFGNVMRIGAIDIFNMQGDASIHGESLEPFAHQLSIKRADLRRGEIDLKYQKWPAGNVNGATAERLIHWQIT